MMKTAKGISKFTVILKLNRSFKISFYERKYNAHRIFTYSSIFHKIQTNMIYSGLERCRLSLH